jgi:predicted nucleotidyltransferase
MNFARPFTVLTPTLDGDVLEVLARADQEYTGRKVTSLVARGSERGVRDALDRLATQGIVISTRAGQAKLYRLNRDHLAAPAVQTLANLRASLLERLRATVDSWDRQPVAGVLFGSVARREASEDSDLDLLIIRPADCQADNPKWERQLMDLQAAVTAWTGNDARVLEYGADELDSSDHAPDPVIVEAIRDGVAFHGSPDDLRRMTRRR